MSTMQVVQLQETLDEAEEELSALRERGDSAQDTADAGDTRDGARLWFWPDDETVLWCLCWQSPVGGMLGR